ncbi:MAG: hypothetical protein DMG58_35885 [Acidobacteria bacterium]|nr:MAG: hypothetical protein DMG58_35885 [Acidobacteriota bacterium]
MAALRNPACSCGGRLFSRSSAAAEYLWIQQAEDGGWHSHTYGLLRSGQSLTPFVLQALLEVPEDSYSRDGNRVDRVSAFNSEQYTI